jgi:hypothetical protein
MAPGLRFRPRSGKAPTDEIERQTAFQARSRRSFHLPAGKRSLLALEQKYRLS